MRLLVAVVLLALLSPPAGAQDADGTWVQCRVLQCKLNRLYFDVGEESRVFAGHRAVVIRKKDTLWSGVIEQAYEGVSISEKISAPPEIKSVTAFVQTAPLDSHAVLRIGTIILPALPAARPAVVFDGMSTLTGGLIDSVVIAKYVDVQSMQIDFQARLLDGILTYQADYFGDEEIKVESAPAPYLAAIVPNASSALNRRRLLTSSLMYRFDTVIARGLFDGSGIRFESRLVTDSPSSSWFAFDPEKGRRLLRASADKATAVRIYVPDSELRKVAGYLADLLARDQFKSVLTESREECDLSLVFIPANSRRPDATLRAMLDLLGPDSAAVVELSASIREVSAQLQNADESVEPFRRRQAWLAAELVLIGDLGCYPLFRPTLYFVSHKSIRGSIFNSDGGINPVGLVRVRRVGRVGGR